MQSVTADDRTLLKDVGLLKQTVKICDPAGRLMGLFLPVQSDQELTRLFDAEETTRRLASNAKGATHEEMWGRIKQLDAEINRRKAAGERPLTEDEGVAFCQALRESQGRTGGEQ